MQTFVADKSDKNSFIRRSLPTFSLPFSQRDPRSKSSKSSKLIEAKHITNMITSAIGGNNSRPENHDNYRSNPVTNAFTVVTVALAIPTHIEHPVTTSSTIAEISVCSMDKSLVSKLSVQSSPSVVTTQPIGLQNKNLMTLSSSSSVAALAYQKSRHSQNEYHHYYQQNCLGLEGSIAGINQARYNQCTGFSEDSYVQKENPLSAPIGHRSKFPAVVESLQRIPTGFPTRSMVTINHKQSSKQPIMPLSIKLTMLGQVEFVTLPKESH